MKVAIYSRVSTSHHHQNPAVQAEELSRYCKARGWEVYEDIVDHGYSGGTDQRPGLKKLMALVRSRQIDGVVVLKLDRLFRSLKHLVTVLDEFQALGVLFVATKDNVDYSTPAGRLFVQVLGSLGEFEKGLARERTLLGLAHAKSRGKRLGRPRTYDVQQITTLQSQGLSHREIAKQLNVSRGAVYRAIQSVSKTPKNSAHNSQSNQGVL